jgi:hypothetical protein
LGNLPEIPATEFPRSKGSGDGFIRKYVVDTAITWDNLKVADTVLSDQGEKVYDTLLLDAIHALGRVVN